VQQRKEQEQQQQEQQQRRRRQQLPPAVFRWRFFFKNFVQTVSCGTRNF